MIIYTEACFFCKHLNQSTKNGRQSNYKCVAFREGIPEDIYQGNYDHRHPYPNDLGIRFEIGDNHKDDVIEIDNVFKSIESRRRTRIDNPMYINPLPNDSWQTKTDQS